MASSLIEQLPGRIARLEAKHGPDDPYVKDLKEQLRASKATQGQTAQEVYRAQVFHIAAPSSTTAALPAEAVSPASPSATPTPRRRR